MDSKALFGNSRIFAYSVKVMFRKIDHLDTTYWCIVNQSYCLQSCCDMTVLMAGLQANQQGV